MTRSRPPARASVGPGGEAAAAARHFFDTYIRGNRQLDSLGDLREPLPSAPAEVLSLQVLCLGEAQRALKAGHHTEARRLGSLAHQLRRLSGGPSRSRSSSGGP